MSNHQSVQTPSVRSVFDNDEDTDRQSLSSADVSAEGAPEETPQAHFRPAKQQVYATPQTRSATSHIAPLAKDKLEKVSPRGKRCIVTNEEYPRIAIEAAHLLRRATKPGTLTHLEYAFNLKYKQLHIDTTRNLAYLRVDQHRSFDNKGFLLLPTLDVLERVKTFTFAEKKPGGPTYKDVFGEDIFKYRIVPLQLALDGNTVFRLTEHDPEYERIFPLSNPPTLPIFESHANPFFVIANAGPKLEPNMDLVPDAVKANPAIFGDLALLRMLWGAWMSRTPSDTWKAVKYISHNGGGDKRGGGANDGAGAPPDGKGPERRSTRSSSSRHDGSPTPSQGSNRAAGRAGRTVPYAGARLPDLGPDDCSDGVDSDVLTEDAVQLVPYMDRRFFVRNWLDGKPVHSDEDQVQRMNSGGIEI
ncbi:hypothetical protein C8J57DRAFT_1732593 [Mycena rebaudengoi]|nr:hypothetical protein C8J57DRAFT_1732593 [Mycena rebaudengoi]